MQKELTKDSIMPIGAYKGLPLSVVPENHLKWLFYTKRAFGPIKEYIGKNIDVFSENQIRENKKVKHA